MDSQKQVLIRESYDFEIENINKKNDGEYVLEGIFGVIDQKNRNERIYSEDEYIPQIEALQKKVEEGKLLGELDHPDTLEVRYKNVSHVIDDLYYDKNNKVVRGKVRLLNTDAGKNAKALVDGKVPLHISSRASGVVENDYVKLRKLVTYDLVSDPGFESAELKSMNESLGIQENNICVFELNNENSGRLINNNDKPNTEPMEGYLTENEFNEYSKKVSQEVENLKENIEELKKNIESSGEGEGNSGEFKEWVSSIAKDVNGLSSELGLVQTEVESLKKHNNYIVENMEYLKEYSENNNDNIKRVKDYTNHLNSLMEKLKDYSNYINENLTKLKDYSEHIADSAGKRAEYQDYVNHNVLDNLIEHSNHNTENIKKVKEYTNYLMDNIKEIAQEGGPSINEGKKNGLLSEGFEKNGKGTSSSEERNEETNQTLKKILESAKEKKAGSDGSVEGFLNYVSDSKRKQYKDLSEDLKQKLIENFENEEFSNAVEADRIWDRTIEEASKPHWFDDAPQKYKELYEQLSSDKKRELYMRSRLYDFSDQDEVKEWWEMQGLEGSINEVIDERNRGKDPDTDEFDNDPRIQQLRRSFRN